MTADPDPASGPAAGSASGQAPGAAPCFAFVGPSGAGKDSVMAAVARARPDVLLATRVITRSTLPSTAASAWTKPIGMWPLVALRKKRAVVSSP